MKVLVLRKLHVCQMKIFHLVNLLLTCLLSGFYALGQPANDACSNAIPICPNTTVSGDNFGATGTVCPDCEDDFTFCFSGENTVWYRFTTNANGGNVTIDFSNLSFNPLATRGTLLQAVIVSAIAPCDASTFTAVSNCETGSAVDFQLSATGLSANSDYYLVINGAQNGTATLPAEASFDLVASGTGIDRLPVGISIGGPSGIICPSDPVSFTAYVQNCTDTSAFSWTVNGVLTALTTSQYWQTSSLQNGDLIAVSCTCFDVCPESASYTFGTVTVDPLTVDAGVDVTISSGETVVLNGSSNGTDFIWSPTNEVSSPFSLTTIVTPATTTTYYLTATDANCSLVDQVTVFVDDALTIPGSFSPNGDGVNDKWLIEGIEFYPDAHVLIYDRWGQQVVDIAGYSFSKAWDGTKLGKAVTDGVYFYELNLNDTSHSIMKGSITVIR